MVNLDASASPEVINEVMSTVVDKLNTLMVKARTIGVYLHSFMTTDSFNKEANRMGSEFDLVMVGIQKIDVLLEAWIGQFKEALPEILALGNSAGDHAFPLTEIAEQSQYLMSEQEEILSSDLSLSGASAWSKLQGTVTSQKTVDFELDGKMQTLPMPALINLHAHPDESVRRRAYEVEMAAWGNGQRTVSCLHERDQRLGEHAQCTPRPRGCPA